LQLDKAGRIAAGHGCFVIFHLLTSSVVHPIRMMYDGRSPVSRMARGLTPKERELLHDLGDQVADIAETFRKLAWRLAKVNGT